MTLIPYGRSREEYGYFVCAKLWVITSDLATIMRDGLFWDETNVTACKFQWERHIEGWYYTRVVTIRDLDHHTTSPLWTATLKIYGRPGAVDPRVSSLKISDISVGDVDSAVAGYKESKEEVYRYDKRRMAGNFNSLCPGRNLEGWWPWPRVSLTARADSVPVAV